MLRTGLQRRGVHPHSDDRVEAFLKKELCPSRTSERRRVTKCLVFPFSYQRSCLRSISERRDNGTLDMGDRCPRKERRTKFWLESFIFVSVEGEGDQAKGVSTHRGYGEGLTDIPITFHRYGQQQTTQKCECVFTGQARAETAEDCGVLSSLTVFLCLSGGTQGAGANCSLMWGICSHIC